MKDKELRIALEKLGVVYDREHLKEGEMQFNVKKLINDYFDLMSDFNMLMEHLNLKIIEEKAQKKIIGFHKAGLAP